MKLKITTTILGMLILLPALAHAQLSELMLENEKIQLIVTPDAGGRVLSFALHQQPNMLKTGAAIRQKPVEKIDENTPFIPYFGHEVWFGPQKQWWTDQTLLPQRKKQKAIWPPDPFSSLSPNQVLIKTADKIVLKSPPSPINGLAVEKTFALVADDPRQLDLGVKAINTRQQPVAWDVWFNSRTSAHTRIYAPVANDLEVRRLDWDESVPYVLDKGLLRLQTELLPHQKNPIKGKIFFQPSEGWFAAFNQQQLLIVQFPLHAAEEIHPDQGQLEFYMDYDPTDTHSGILEMEVHAAYKKLNPGEEMQARERWTLIHYSGDESIEAQRKFLMGQLKSLKGI